MTRILTVVGARPQFIKAAAVSHAVAACGEALQEDILHTGQHYDDDMSAAFFRELDIPAPRYNLGVGQAAAVHQLARMVEGIGEVLESGLYDAVLVYGDTTSTLAGALAAAQMAVPLMHVEAGLRSGNRDMPEELNRVLADHASSLLFAPTRRAVDNLRLEGIAGNRVVECGDVMYDNVLRYAAQAAQCSSPDWPEEGFVLATVHRNYNTDNAARLQSIAAALGEAAAELGRRVLLPLHPRLRKALHEGGVRLPDAVVPTAPLSYLQTLAALQHASLVITDSGGLQKEAYFSARPVVVLRHETEWGEIVEAGAGVLAEPEGLAAACRRMMGRHVGTGHEFGDGQAARRIVESIVQF